MNQANDSGGRVLARLPSGHRPFVAHRALVIGWVVGLGWG
jgi:hypothetical protein